MKLMKAVKQLKFWSIKKKLKKSLQYHKLEHDNYNYYYTPHPPPSRPPPPRPLLCEYQFNDTPEPSAPPLPPWLEPTHDTFSDEYNNQVDQSSSTEKHCTSISKEMPTHEISWVDPFAKAGQSGCTEEKLKHGTYSDECDNQVDQSSSTEKHCTSIFQEMPTHEISLVDPFANVGQSGCSEEDCISVNMISEEMQDGSTLPGYVGEDMTRRREARIGNLFGCVVEVGTLLFRCLIPCFRVSEHRVVCHSSTEALLSTGLGKKSV